MPDTYLVKAVTGRKEWEGRHGTFVDYDLALDGPDAPATTVVLTQKPDTKAPAQGSTLFGHLESGQYGVKFKKDQRQDGVQTAMNGSQGSSTDDATRTSIERQVACKCAAEVIASWATPITDQPKAAETIHFLVDTFYDAIAGPQPVEAAPKTADEEIPF